jgi:hypothetical protein
VVNGKPSPLGVNIYRFPSLPKNRSFVHRSARQVVAALADVFSVDDAALRAILVFLLAKLL